MQGYIESHIAPEHPYLHALWRATHLHLNYPRMASGHLQGEVLRMLVLMIRPRLVLEIGTFTGYSALAMASALEPGAMLHTYEINDEQEDFTRPWIENSPWSDRVTLHIGDILKTLSPLPREGENLALLDSCAQPLPSLTGGVLEESSVPLGRAGGGSFDLVFIDADKRHYVDYFEAVLPHVRPGGFILADNTLWGGQVCDDLALCAQSALNAKSSQLQGIMAFNDLVASDPRVETVILPLRDGLSILRKKE